MPKTPASNLLLTGRPGCGKTTVVRRVVERISSRCLTRFYAREIREQGRRVGFEAVGLGGSQMVLADMDLNTDKRVGWYGVDVDEFDALKPGRGMLQLVLVIRAHVRSQLSINVN